MSALDIVRLPGYASMWARRIVVEKWQAAGSPPVNSAGRLYAAQKYLYDGWRAGRPGFNPADNPDDESQRLAHVRFVALDITPTNERIRRLTNAGFIRPYSREPWHFELPNVYSYPIVRTLPAGGGLTPIYEEEEEDPMEPKIVGHKGVEISVLAPWLPNGFLTAKLGTQIALGWSRLYSPTKDGLVPMYERDVYLGMIASATALAAGYQAALPKPGSGGPSDNGPVLAAISGVSEQISNFPAPPTALENGQAARNAIVK